MNKKLLIISFCTIISLLSLKAKNEEPLKFLRLQVWDNVYNALINQTTRQVSIRHIAQGNQVRGVEFVLEKNATISPDPKSLVGNWPQDTTFVVKSGEKEYRYNVRLADYVADAAPLNADGNDIWKIIWSEEFNDPELDTLVWSKTPRNKANWGDTMTDNESLYELKDGSLILKGKVNTDNPSDTSKYLTGGVWGRDKRSFTLGRVDVKAKYTSAKGYWPAIWLLPQGGNSPYSKEGEIDMVEHLNFDDFVYMTIHTEYTNLVNKENPKNHIRVPINVNDFNIYSVEIYQDKLVYLVNNKVTFVYPRLEPHIDNQFPFTSHDYYVILSSQLGGNWVGEIDPAQLPVEMSVDWVRVYRTK